MAKISAGFEYGHYRTNVSQQNGRQQRVVEYQMVLVFNCFIVNLLLQFGILFIILAIRSVFGFIHCSLRSLNFGRYIDSSNMLHLSALTRLVKRNLVFICYLWLGGRVVCGTDAVIGISEDWWVD